jgi:hypothetical protein
LYQLLEDVLPYLAAFFVLDSLVLAPAGEVLFVRRLRAFRVDGSGLAVAGLLPTGDVAGALDLPFRLGVETLAVRTEDGVLFFAWKDLGPVQLEQRTVRVGGHAVTLPSPEAAERAADLLARLRDTPGPRRGDEIRRVLDEASNLEAVRARRGEYDAHRRLAEALGFVLLAGLFVVVPLGIGKRVPRIPDPALVIAGLVPVYLGLLGLGFRALRRCGMPAGRALSTLAPLLFFPAGAAHLRSLLGRKLWLDVDPLALGAVLLSPADFRSLARRRFHVVAREEAAEPRLREHAGHARAQWQKIVAAAGATEAEVLRAPAAADPTAASYCPVCGDQYRSGFTSCSACGMALEPLASPSA